MDEERIDRGDGVRIAFRRGAGNGPTVVFLPGFGSDMTGDKATALAADAAARGRASLLLDYSGHGASDGEFEAGTIGRWLADALLVLDRASDGPVVLVGSSMGGWIAMLAARARPARVRGLVLVAPAPDFTEWGFFAGFSPAQRDALERDGFVRMDVAGRQGVRITRALIEDGRAHALLGGPIALPCPVRILQGMRDDAVPWGTAVRIAELVTGEDVRVMLVKDGDHRLSRAGDLALLREVVEEVGTREEMFFLQRTNQRTF